MYTLLAAGGAMAARSPVRLHWPEVTEPDLPRTGALVASSLRGKGGRRARARLYRWAVDGEALRGLPHLLARLQEGSDRLVATGARIREVARWLAFDGREPGPVALGIALLGLGHDPLDRDKLLVLARHPALEPFVCAALATASGDVAGSAAAVAEATHGAGGASAVDWLSAATNPVVQRRLVLAFQYRSSPLDADDALAAARADLLGQLRRVQGTDQELVDGAVGVMRTLLTAPAPGAAGARITDVPEAAEVLVVLLGLTATHRPWLEHYLLAADAQAWLLAGARDALPEPQRQVLSAAAEQVIARPGWHDMAVRALALPNHPYRATAEQVAASLPRAGSASE
jgi:hypothetical protein